MRGAIITYSLSLGSSLTLLTTTSSAPVGVRLLSLSREELIQISELLAKQQDSPLRGSTAKCRLMLLTHL